MTKKLSLLLLLFCSYTVFAQDFISIWDTSQPGTSGANEITIPTNPDPAFIYDYTVDWGDGTPETNITGNITHTYATPGLHTISISGDFPSIYFNGGGDRRKIIEILGWGTIQWQTMENAFLDCENLNFDAIDSPDLSQVTSLKNMFKDCTSFNGIINNWNVNNITDISGIFSGASIFNRPLNNWFSILSVTDMSDAFNGAQLFNEPLDGWQVGLVTDMSRMFRSAADFNQNINNWEVGQVTNMSELFSGASSYSQPLNEWTVDNVEDMSSMLAFTSYNLPLNKWKVGNVTNMAGMFRGSSFNQPLNLPNWDVSKVTNMSSMFENATDFNQPINNWIVDSVTDMSNMFAGSSSSLTAFDQALNLWDVDNVTNMAGMFKSSSFNNATISNWNVANVTNMSEIFERAELFNHPLNWTVSEVTDMSKMFKQAFAFNQPLNWDVSKVTDMSNMFNGATVFDQSLNSWGASVSAVTTMEAMFNNAPVFNQPLDGWIVSSVNDMTGMFFDALAFDQNLGDWDVSNVTDMTGMLANSALSQANYDNTLIGWALLTLIPDVELGALNLTYCDGRDARQKLIDDFNWTINGDTVNCPFVLCTTILSPTNGETMVPDNFNLRWAPAPGATGYFVSLRSQNGFFPDIVMEDVNNVVAIDFTTNFTPGDVIFATVVPYNGAGPATGCTEISFTIIPNWVNSPDAFKLIVDTNEASNTTISDRNQLQIQTNENFSYNYSIDWGDGEFNHNVTDDIIHTYVTPGIYTVSIIGDYPHHFYPDSAVDENKLINVEQWGTQVWQSMERTFYSCTNIVYNPTDIPNLSQVTSMSRMFESSAFNGNINNWDVSNVTDMSRTFIGTSIYNQPLDLWDVSNVTDMSDMFLSAVAFNRPIGNWEVGNVTTMRRMFNGFNVNMIFNQPLNDWDVSKVTNMETMFRNNIDFDRPLNNWTVSAVTTMQGMFENATAFNENIDDWNVSSVTTMNSMFSGATNFNQPLNDWNVSLVNTMAFMFQDAQSFNQTFNNWDVSDVITMESMFENALAFNELINWNANVSQVTNMRAMFKGAETFNQPLNDWDVNSVVTMQSMFENALAFNQPLPDWDVSAVATMASMFKNAIVFDQPIGNWNVSSVTLMNSMFEDAQAFNKPINNWDMNVSSVTRMDAMFKNALAFDQPLNSWDTGEALTMAEMFSGASVFNQPIDSWNVSFVATMESMFQNAITYNQTMNSWNVASVNTMRQMFSGATAFNALIDDWNVRSVQTMEEMFDGASLFNRTINSWRVSGVSNMNRMFRNASAYNESLDRWDIGTVSMQSMFENASVLDQSLADWNVSSVTNMSDMLDNTALSLINYDNTLIAWSEQTLPAGITLGAQGLTYCEAEEERQSMIDTFGWTISDDASGCPIPECTQLVSPSNLDTDVPVNTNLSWEPVLYAKGYRLTVLVQPGNITLVNNVTVNETSYEFAADFSGGETVSVTLTPFNDTGDAVSCTEESFVITSTTIPTAPECTNLTSPVDGATNVAVTTDLSWAPVNNADGYRITAGTSSGVNNVINQDVGNVISYDIPTDLAENITIYVTITPYNEVGIPLAVCNEEIFTTETIPVAPVCTNLISPANNDTDVPVDTDISWAPVANATGYIVVVGNTIGGNEIANNIDVKNVTTYDFPDNLSGNRTFYVTIIPYNEVDDAAGCLEESFRTEAVSTVPDCTNLNSPSDNDIDVATNLASIAWGAVTDATGYRITVSGTANNNVTNFEVTTGTSYNFTNPFLNGEVVSVTIVPFNGTINATGCTPESFTIVAATTATPDCTNLNSPSDNDIDVATNLASIAWDAVTDATGYRITVSGTANNNVTNFEVTTGTSYNFTNPFLNDEVVSVTIVPFNGIINATGCTPETFTIVAAISTPPLCTNLSAPIANAIDVPVDVSNITWDAVDDAVGYRLSVTGSISTANNISGFDIITGTSYDFTNDFVEGETVTVIIVPFDTMSDTSGCTSQSFTIVSNAPTIPNCTSLISSENSSTGVNNTISISWEEISNADGYRLSIGTSPGATNILEEDVSILTSYSFQNNLPEGTTYYINILPYNSQGVTTDCAEQSFTTAVDDDSVDRGDGSDIDNTLYGFSPNGDGNNDFWEIDGIEANPENIVYIYNRWGDLIFQIEDYDNQSNVFKGNANMKTSMGASNLPNGTYFFNIQVPETHTLKKLRGFVVIKR